MIMGVHNPVDGSETVTEILSNGWEEKVGGKIEFVADPYEIVERTLAPIDKKRAALKLPVYDPAPWGRSGDRRVAGSSGCAADPAGKRHWQPSPDRRGDGQKQAVGPMDVRGRPLVHSNGSCQ